MKKNFSILVVLLWVGTLALGYYLYSSHKKAPDTLEQPAPDPIEKKTAPLPVEAVPEIDHEQETARAEAAREANVKRVEEIYKNNLSKYKNNDDMMVARGLLADRKTGRLIIQAETTGLGKTDAIEFLLLAEKSSNDYEGLLVAFVTASDVHKALLFIGAELGKSVNIHKLMLWPKGERLMVSIRSDDSKILDKEVPLENFVRSTETKEPLKALGMVFTGSQICSSRHDANDEAYAADVRGPYSIIANYNEPDSVLDMPYNAPQGQVYGSQKPNPDYIFPKGTPLEIIIEKEYKDGKKRVKDLRLDINIAPQSSSVVCRVIDGNKALLNKDESLNSALKIFTDLVANGHDPFVTIVPSDEVELKDFKKFCGLLASIETVNGIRIEPPLEGHIYYKSFLPAERHRKREDRIEQPWELHFSKQDSKISGNLVYIKQIWKDGVVKPDLKVTETKISSPTELRKGLDTQKDGMSVILVYAPKEMTYGELMRFISPVLSTHPIIYVFQK